ncbi:MAG: hypothetical protein AAF467_26425 [Actinomycetota bacterium]
MAARRKNYPLRLDPEIHAAIERWAADDLRSVNAQIEFALRLALKQAGRFPDPPSARDEASNDHPPKEEPE